jgi:hypothetical protein
MGEMKIKVGMDTSSFDTGIGRLQTQVSKLNTGTLAGGFRSLAADLASANSPAEALSRTFGRLGDLLKGTIFGAAGLAVGKLLAAPFEQVSAIVKDSTDIFSAAIRRLQDSGDALSFSQAVGEVDSLTQSIQQIDQAIQKIDANPLLRAVAAVTGSRKEMEAQKSTLLQNAGGRLAQGLANETTRTKASQGMSSDERQLLEISDRSRERAEKIRNTFKGKWSPVADQALEESFNLFVQERNAKLQEIADKGIQKEVAERIKTDQEILRREEEEREMERRSYDRRRDLKRERMVEDFRKGLDEARSVADEAQRRGVPVEQIQQERALKAFDQQGAAASRASGPLEVMADDLQKMGGGGRFALVGGGEDRELTGTAKEQLKALEQIVKNTQGGGAGSGVQ